MLSLSRKILDEAVVVVEGFILLLLSVVNLLVVLIRLLPRLLVMVRLLPFDLSSVFSIRPLKNRLPN